MFLAMEFGLALITNDDFFEFTSELQSIPKIDYRFIPRLKD